MTRTVTDWQAAEAAYYHQAFVRAPVTLVRGEGARVWDDAGNEYLDFAAGIAVTTLGHSDPELVEAVAAQARELIHTSNLFYTVPQLEVAQRLIDQSALDRVFFVNSGGEATETCVKIARKWGRTERDGAFRVITTDRSFHGRSLAMTAATGTPAYHAPFEPMPDGFAQVPFNDLGAMRAAVDASTAAIMIELVQAEGGVWSADPEYVRELRRLCDAEGLLLIFDEVQTGIGRTGTMFAYEQFDVEPDVLALAKGLGGGLPIGAALSKEHASVLRPGDHGSTFSGNPLVCAAARVVLDRVASPGFLDDVRGKGMLVSESLERLAADTGRVADVRGLGLLVGFDLPSAELADAVIGHARDHGLLLIKAGAATLRIVPALSIETAELEQGLRILDAAVRAAEA